MSNLDKALDEMIVDKKKRGSRRGRGARAGAPSSGGAGAGATARARYSGILPSSNVTVNTRQATAAAAIQAGAVGSEKIIVSNLPPDVNEAQIKELFSTTVGPLKEVNLHYDSAGKSKGVANVAFTRKGDGTKAYNQYNNRLIDGKRPMKIEIIVDPGKAPAPSLASRVAPAAGAGPGKGRKGKKEDDQLAGVAEAMEGVESNGKPARGSGGGRGGRRGRGRGGRSKSDRPAKSAADLDAEMEDYTAVNTAPAPAAAAAA